MKPSPKQPFPFDRLLSEDEICNLGREKQLLSDYVERGVCVKIYGRRNFGKTSLVRNVVAKKWEESDPERRVVIYADFFACNTDADISIKLAKAFNSGMSQKKNLFERGRDWLKALRSLRPVWHPPTDEIGLGSFSVTTEHHQPPNWEDLLAGIDALQRQGRFAFLLIFDEFQEIHRIAKLEAKLRGALQVFAADLPIIVMGSKFHLLSQIFEKPRAPFHGWGHTVEFHNIPPATYFAYMEKRFTSVGKTLHVEASDWLQATLDFIPEAINRFCDFLLNVTPERKLDLSTVTKALDDYSEASRSVYAQTFAAFSRKEQHMLKALVKVEDVSQVAAKRFLEALGATVSKSGAQEIMKRFLDQAVVYHVETSSGWVYRIADPLLRLYIKRRHLF